VADHRQSAAGRSICSGSGGTREGICFRNRVSPEPRGPRSIAGAGGSKEGLRSITLQLIELDQCTVARVSSWCISFRGVLLRWQG
jgi:hypothetical protein